MTVIRLSDEEAAALAAKAAAQGLTLKDWLRKLAALDAPARIRNVRYTLSELVEQCDASAPLSDEDRAWLDAPPSGREAL